MSLFLAGLLALSGGSGAPAPAVADPAVTPAQAADQVAYQSAMRNLLAALRASASARDRALAAQLVMVVPGSDGSDPAAAEQAASGALLRAAAQAAPDDALVQSLWANADPRLSGCDAQNPCPQRADALAKLQPDNVVAWVPVLNAAFARKDAAGVDAALAQMAQAHAYDDFLGQTTKAWVDVYTRHPLPVPTSDREAGKFSPRASAFVAAMGMAAATAIPPFDGVVKSCHRQLNPDASATRFRDCAQVGRTMLAQADSLLGHMLGRGLLRVSGQATAADVEMARNAQWQQENWQRLAGRQIDPASVDAAAADWTQAGNEISVMQMQFRRAGIPWTPPAGWVAHNSRGEPVPPLGDVAVGSGAVTPQRP